MFVILDCVDEPPLTLSLREQRHIEAVHHVTTIAFELFEQQGYQNTTIAQIAKAAKISEATFYRWFGTKEGLITTDPLRNQGGSMLKLIDLEDLIGSIDRIAATSNFSGMTYILQEPSVRVAINAELDDYAEQLIPDLQQRGHSPLKARVLARSLVFGVYFGSLEQWYLDGSVRPLRDVFYDALTSTGFMEQLTASPSEDHQ